MCNYVKMNPIQKKLKFAIRNVIMEESREIEKERFVAEVMWKLNASLKCQGGYLAHNHRKLKTMLELSQCV